MEQERQDRNGPADASVRGSHAGPAADAGGAVWPGGAGGGFGRGRTSAGDDYWTERAADASGSGRGDPDTARRGFRCEFVDQARG